MSRVASSLVGAVLLAMATAAGAGPITLRNARLLVRLDTKTGVITRLSADARGRAGFASDILTVDGMRLTPQPTTFTCRSNRATTRCRAANGTRLRLALLPRTAGVRVTVEGPSGAAPRVLASFRQDVLYGLFDRGMVQFVGGQAQSFAASSPLRLFYTMDRRQGSVALRPRGRAYATLLSGAPGVTGIVLSTAPAGGPADAWRPHGPDSPTTRDGSPRLDFTLYGNDKPYPAHLSGRTLISTEGEADLDATLIATYGSAAGVLGSYLEPGSAYPTLALPQRTYGAAFDFFDPDAWSTVNTLAFSGDPLLTREAKAVLERARAGMRPDGQLPHHFEPSGPTYVSIAKSKQTGPNIFWTLAAIDYATAAGDEAWLRARYPDLRRATDWLLAAYDPALRLIRADGPLFIDVFRRDGFTLDTNVMAARLFDRMTAVAHFAGDADAQARYRARAADVRAGLQALWASDHFVTQLNPDGSRRDLVDYDGNFGAVAFGANTRAKARATLARLDAGPHTHPGGYGTWVSEVRYDASQCYGGNDGDSDTAMARILWLDLAARTAVGDHAMFETLYRRHRDLVIDRVWMTERIGANGDAIRAPGYHEYPEIAAMVARELRYGIRLEADAVEVRPFGVDRFDYAVGGLKVGYGPGVLRIRVPGFSLRRFIVSGLPPGRRYRLSTGQVAVVSPGGELHFEGGAGVMMTATPEPTAAL